MGQKKGGGVVVGGGGGGGVGFFEKIKKKNWGGFKKREANMKKRCKREKETRGEAWERAVSKGCALPFS